MREHLLFPMVTALVGIAAHAVAATPVAGLVDEAWVGGLTQPTGIAFLPGSDSSRFLVIEKAGAIKLVDRSLPAPSWTSLGTIGVCTTFEMGLLGIAVYPDFDATHHVYLYRTENDGGCGAPRENQVVRVTIDPFVDLGSLAVVPGGQSLRGAARPPRGSFRARVPKPLAVQLRPADRGALARRRRCPCRRGDRHRCGGR